MGDALRSFLVERGVEPAEIDEAVADGSIVGLAIDRLMFGGGANLYDTEEFVARVDMDRDVAEALWRAMGYPDNDPHRRVLGDLDALAIVGAAQLFDLPDQLPELLHQTRELSSALGRVAETVADGFMGEFGLGQGDDPEPEEMAELITVGLRVEQLSPIIDFMLRRQLKAVVERRLDQGTDDGSVTATVGFADIAGFTRLSHRLSVAELAELVDRFEGQARDLVAAAEGRVVKTIGDEIMFVADTAAVAVEIGLELSRAAHDDELLPDLHVGLAAGPMAVRRGDYFGSTVNKASRLTGLARPGSVLASQSVKEAVAEDAEGWVSLGRVNLKDLGPTRVWVIRS